MDSIRLAFQTIAHQPELELIKVTKRFGNHTAVQAVSLRLEKGEFVSLLGPSGCGKTTTLRMIAGFVLPDEGSILLRGADISEVPPYRRNVGLLFQNYALFPHMNVAENVGFGPRMRRLRRAAVRERVRWALDLVQLSELSQRWPHELSGGQQQRVAVARVLAADASVLLLDEPFSNLDAKLRLRMQEDLRELQLRLGIATVHVTHDQDEAMSMSDRIVVMKDGRVEQVGTPEAIYRRPESPFVAQFIGKSSTLRGVFHPPLDGGTGAVFQIGSAGHLVVSCQGDRGNGPATLLVRPEHIEVAVAGTMDGCSNVLAGQVRRVVYLGSRSTVHVRLNDGQDIVVEIPNPSDNRPSFSPDTKVDVRVPEDSVVPLAMRGPAAVDDQTAGSE
jgi:putative spermidine/putrescine transport system ATP-binding protein